MERVPLAFEPNVGQTDPRVAFLARGSDFTLFLTRRGEAIVSYARLHGPRRRLQVSRWALRTQFVGSRPRMPKPTGRLAGRINWLVGHDPRGWRRNIPTFRAVRREAVYPGIGLVYYSRGGQLEYDFRIAAKADPGEIAMRFPGAAHIAVGKGGDLLISVAGHTLRELRPLAYQQTGHGRARIGASYALGGHGTVRLRLGRYDRSRPLVVDPVLVYSTYLGGGGNETGQALDVGPDGSLYVSGTTYSADFPLAHAYSGQRSGIDVYVTKFAPDGRSLAYSTYYGGTFQDYGYALKVGSDGSAYIGGQTQSQDLPLVNAVESTNPGNVDGFVAKLTPDGSALSYSTYFGRGAASVHDVALDSSGSAYIAGSTQAAGLATSGAFQTALRGTSDDFVAKLAPNGGSVVYASYLGGSDREDYTPWLVGHQIAVDDAGAAYVTGLTDSTDFPTTAGAFQTTHGAIANYREDAFVTKIAPDGQSLEYSTYLGGNGPDIPYGIAVDGNGSAYVAGLTRSGDFPTQGGLSETISTSSGFVTKLSPDGSSLVYSTRVGAADSYTELYGIAVDSDGRAYVTGMTGSAAYPVVNPVRSAAGGGDDAIVSVLAQDGGSLLFSTYLGGSGNDYGRAVAVASDWSVYIAGDTDSQNFSTASAFQPTAHGGTDTFAVKLSPVTPTVTGTPQEGQTLEVSLNGWPSAPPTSYTYAYHWQDCDPDGVGCVAIAAATGASYTLTANDVGSTIRVSVTADTVGAVPQTVDTPPTDVVESTDQVTEPTVDYAAPYHDMIEGDNPWGYWQLDESTGSTASDSSGNGHGLTYTGSGITPGVPGRYALGAHVSGVGSASMATPPTLTSFTTDLWIKTGAGESSSAVAQLFQEGTASGTSQVRWDLTGGQLAITYPLDFGDTSRHAYGPHVDDGNWHHLAVVRDTAAGTLNVYVDGVQVGSVTSVSTSAYGPFSGTQALAFGNWSGDTTGIDYTLDEPALYSSALDAVRIRDHSLGGEWAECFDESGLSDWCANPDSNEIRPLHYGPYPDPEPSATVASAPPPSLCQSAYTTDVAIYCAPDIDAAATAGGGSLVVGISDDSSGTAATNYAPLVLRDPHFQALNTAYVRRIVPWNLIYDAGSHSCASNPDVAPDPAAYAKFTAFYNDARHPTSPEQLLHILVAFRHRDDLGTNQANYDSLPSKIDYANAVKCFQGRYPGVSAYSAWNEPNHGTEPTRVFSRTSKKASRNRGVIQAAYFTYFLQKACEVPRCVVVAADLNQERYSMLYLDKYRHYLNGFIHRHQSSDPALQMPSKWGFHAYQDVENNEAGISPTNGTAHFLAGMPSGSSLWLSEIGSRVDSNQASFRPRNTDATQKLEVCFIFQLAAYYHVERLYYYQYWEPDQTKAQTVWDSGLAAPTADLNTIGQPPRPAYDAVQSRGC